MSIPMSRKLMYAARKAYQGKLTELMREAQTRRHTPQSGETVVARLPD